MNNLFKRIAARWYRFLEAIGCCSECWTFAWKDVKATGMCWNCFKHYNEQYERDARDMENYHAH